MVVTILESAPDIEAVNYSDTKIEKGQAFLLTAENFPFDMTAKEHKLYLDKQGNTNPNVTKKQFHASISTKGKRHSFDELTQAAKKYMEYMGYGDNPYVIYAHKDTTNNHVHIVSSRIGNDGKKISDSLEHMRSQSFIKNVLGVDFSKNISTDIEQAMSYSISSEKQIHHLLEKQGYSIGEKQEHIELYKSGAVQGTIKRSDIKALIRKNTQRIEPKQNRTKALFHKYSKTGNLKEFTDLMHQKFGVEIVLHYPNKTTAKWENQKITPYGYSVFDHKNKIAYKGSEILKFKELTNNTQEPKEINSKASLKHTIETLLLDPKLHTSKLQAELKRLGLTLEFKNILTKDKQLFLVIPHQLHKNIQYQQRIHLSKGFAYDNSINKEVIGKMFGIKGVDVDLKTILPDTTVYHPKLNEALRGDTKKELALSKMELYQLNNYTYLVDHNLKRIVDVTKEHQLILNNINRETKEVNYQPNYQPKVNYNHEHKANSTLASLLSGGENDIDKTPRKKKKRIDQQQQY